MLKILQKKLNEYNRQYHWLNLGLSVFWILLMILDFARVIDIEQSPYLYVDRIIWFIFTIDYVGRLLVAPHKWTYVRKNIFDLIAILPLNFTLTLLNVTHFGRLSRINRIARILGLFGKLSRNKRSILYTNGFIYVVYISLGIITIGSGLFSVAENMSFSDSLWWSVVTVTTVGYGDIYPQTAAGKMIASVLMLLGIGFIGILTSTITEYFSRKNEAIRQVDQENELTQLRTELQEMNQKLSEIEKLLKK